LQTENLPVIDTTLTTRSIPQLEYI